MKLDSLLVEGTDNGTATIQDDVVRLRVNGKTDWFFAPSGNSRMANVTRLVGEVE
ncbi:DUF1349 domain-containing protein, partial [Mesorhizobium sp. M2D.F.Ca.ET.145.01.1.1]